MTQMKRKHVVIPAGMVRDPETYAVIGLAMKIHRELGPGFYEQVYKEAMKVELIRGTIPFAVEVDLPITYSGVVLPCVYRADFICHSTLILEIKAIKEITAGCRAQVLHYLKATNFQRALLLNFGSESLQYERLINTRRP